jgi:Family of unknown function (DUF5519)
MTLARLQEQIAQIEGVVEAKSRFSDRPAWWIEGKEIAHMDSDSVLDIRLTRQVIRARRHDLVKHPEITFRRSGSADWIEIEVTDGGAEHLALELVKQAAAAHSAGQLR